MIINYPQNVDVNPINIKFKLLKNLNYKKLLIMFLEFSKNFRDFIMYQSII